jgi:hypothetical protein
MDGLQEDGRQPQYDHGFHLPTNTNHLDISLTEQQHLPQPPHQMWSGTSGNIAHATNNSAVLYSNPYPSPNTDFGGHHHGHPAPRQTLVATPNSNFVPSPSFYATTPSTSLTTLSPEMYANNQNQLLAQQVQTIQVQLPRIENLLIQLT